MSVDNTAVAVNEVLNTPAPEATPPAADPPAAAAPSTPPALATPEFLKVDDRTVYRTQEDAIKGWNDLKTHASTSAAFKDVAASYGITDPKQVEQLFQELIEHRTRAQGTPAAGKTDSSTVQAAAAGDKLAYDSLSPEWKAHVDHLNKLGYVTKDALKPFEERLNRIDQASQQQQDAHLEAVKNEGVSILKSLVEREKLPSDEESVNRIGYAIEDQIVRSSRDERNTIIPGSAEDRFIRGNSAERASIVETQLKWFLDFGDKFATARTASYVAAKTTAQANQPRTLPPGSPPSSTERTGPMTEEQRVAAVKASLASGGFR